MKTKKSEPRPLYLIAADIKLNWKKMDLAAKAYVEAMQELTSMDDIYLYESADGIVRGFLANAGTWRGEDARRIKAELNSML